MSKEILIPIEGETEWQSNGILTKPKGCELCPLGKKSTGFVPDWVPPEARILFVFSSPEREDTVENRSLSGKMGFYRKAQLLKPFGLTMADVAVANILRCYNGKDQFGKLVYPSAANAVKAELACRQYDRKSMRAGELIDHGVRHFEPNVFVITFGLDALRNGSAFLHLMRKDIQKALDTIPLGGRPCVLFGEPAVKRFAPYCFGPGQGGIKAWRGHIFESTWNETPFIGSKGFPTPKPKEIKNEFQEFDSQPKYIAPEGKIKSFTKITLPAFTPHRKKRS